MRNQSLITLFIVTWFIIACSSVSEEEAVPTRNTVLYNAIDTTKRSFTPGEDTTTLKIQDDSPVSYEEAAEPDPVQKEDRYQDRKNDSKYYIGPTYVFDASVFEDPLVIQNVQEELNTRGYVAGAPDGVMSPTTNYALIEFQKDRGLSATGEINQDTLDALGLELIPAEDVGDEQILGE